MTKRQLKTLIREEVKQIHLREGMFEKIVSFFAKRKGKELAKKFKDDPEVQKKLKKMQKNFDEFEKESEEVIDALDKLIKKARERKEK